MIAQLTTPHISSILPEPRTTPTPIHPMDRISINEPGQDTFLRKVGAFVLDMGKTTALAGAPALAGWLGGPYGVAAGFIGGAVYGALQGNGAKACAIYGFLAGMAGAVFGPAGVGVMSYLGATGSVIKNVLKNMKNC